MTEDTEPSTICRSTAYYQKNRERCQELARLRWHRNHERLLAQKRLRSQKNREQLREAARCYYRDNRDRILEKRRKQCATKHTKRPITEKQRQINREKTRRYRARHRALLKDREKRLLESNPAYKFARILRSRVGKAVKAQYAAKAFKTINLVGCSMVKLLQHLEKQFEPGMGWHNYGRTGWHIDHIIPCAAFDLSQPKQQKKCFHYLNLRPVWAHLNEAKASRIEGELPLAYFHQKSRAKKSPIQQTD